MPEMAMPYNINGFTVASHDTNGYDDLAEIARAEAGADGPIHQNNTQLNSIGAE